MNFKIFFNTNYKVQKPIRRMAIVIAFILLLIIVEIMFGSGMDPGFYDYASIYSPQSLPGD